MPDEEAALPGDEDTRFEAKLERFRAFERKAAELALVVEAHRAAVVEALTLDLAHAKEAVRLTGVHEPDLRADAEAAWNSSRVAAACAEAYAGDLERTLGTPLRLDVERFLAVNEAVAEKEAVDKEFSHYVKKLADLKLTSGKDSKKLARNEQKYDEAMARLEEKTQFAIYQFDLAEERREALVTTAFRAWAAAQARHLPGLLAALDLAPEEAGPCPVAGLERGSAAGGEGGKQGTTTFMALKHRIKYGSAADFEAKDLFGDEASLYEGYQAALPAARAHAAGFMERMAEAVRTRTDLTASVLAISLLPRGGRDATRALGDFERFAEFRSDEVSVEAVRAEVEARLDLDLETEDVLEATHGRWAAEVTRPLDLAAALFTQPTVLAMIKERPAVVASVNHYRAKVDDLEKSLEKARLERAEKGDKPVEAAERKLEGNRTKHHTETEKLRSLTAQLVASMESIEARCVQAAAETTAAAIQIKGRLFQFIAVAAEIDTEGVGSNPPPRPSAAERKVPRWKRRELLRQGLGADEQPLPLAWLRFHQAAAVQAYARRYLTVKRTAKARAEARKSRLEAERKAQLAAEAAEQKRIETEKRERRDREAREEAERVKREMDALGLGGKGGMSGEDMKKYVAAVQGLERARASLEEAEQARDEHAKNLKASSRKVKTLTGEVTDLKGRYNGQVN